MACGWSSGLFSALERSALGTKIAWTPEERAALVNKSDDDPRCRCLVAVGGDGTVSDLLNERPRVPLTSSRPVPKTWSPSTSV